MNQRRPVYRARCECEACARYTRALAVHRCPDGYDGPCWGPTPAAKVAAAVPCDMAWPCVMVDGIDECFIPGGGYRVGAMLWWRHGTSAELAALDTAPRPQPHLAVMTPAGLACLDCPATGGNKEPGRYWTRTGEPPWVTVTPSLLIAEKTPDEWHGFVTAGVLTP